MIHVCLSNEPFTLLQALAAIGEHLIRLQTLELASCPQLTDDGVKWLGRGCPLLESLDLSFCPKITSVGVRYLCGDGGVPGCQDLRLVRIVDTGVDESGKIRLKKKFKYVVVVE
mgnify:CR=1 FL=1